MLLYLKALHIIFIVTWFAGLFYIVRLFIYHVEADAKAEPEKSILISHFKGAQRRLWYGITWPSLVLTWIFGLWLAYLMFRWNFPPWLWTKLGFVAALTVYHLKCHQMFSKLQRGIVCYDSLKLRIWNEVATVFLFVIVFIVVLRSTLTLYGASVIVLLSALLYAGIMAYNKKRNK